MISSQKPLRKPSRSFLLNSSPMENLQSLLATMYDGRGQVERQLAMEIDSPTPPDSKPLESEVPTEVPTEVPAGNPVESVERPHMGRGLMEMPHEIILRIIDEVILLDRTTGRDQIRAHSATYALSRTSAYWQEEVEKRHKVLYLQTSLFPGFARWSLHSDWLFMKDRFQPSSKTEEPKTTAKVGSRESEPSLAVARPKTQASALPLVPTDFQKPEISTSQSVLPPIAAEFSKRDAQESDSNALSDTDSVAGLDCSALSISGSEQSFANSV